MIARPHPRVNYNQIAQLYDAQPFRQKQVDQELLAFLSARQPGVHAKLAILDMGCGTGSQLIANRRHGIDAQMVGLDLFRGMLDQACCKAGDILWVQGDSSAPPFQDQRFDFISNQFSFHHVHHKAAMLAAVLRILRPGGRFVMTNICPHEMRGWLYYRYFPAALDADLQDFLPHQAIVALLRQIGFINLAADLNHMPYAQDLRHFMEIVQRRDTCSELITIPDSAYQAGLEQLAHDIQQAEGSQSMSVPNEICLLTVRAERAS